MADERDTNPIAASHSADHQEIGFSPRLWNLIDSPPCDTTDDALTRRRFMAMALALALYGSVHPAAESKKPVASIPFRHLGSTGEYVSAIGLGGFHIGLPDEKEGIKIIHAAIDSGINFLDNCWDYNNGDSESRMGNALRDGYREKVFLMTKVDGRDRKTAAAQINESLRRFHTDRIDLLQLHEIIRAHEPERVFAPDGAMEALLEAQKAGKIRFIGFTGHKDPNIHIKMLDVARAHGFRFDAVQMPLNVMDAHYESFEKKVLPILVKEKIAVLAMKPMGGGAILKSKAASPIECLHYALDLPVSVVITGCDSMSVLQQAINAAKTFVPLSIKERIALLDKTAPFAEHGKFELYKTTGSFDGTSMHPEWLG